MSTQTVSKARTSAKSYPVRYRARDYTFPAGATVEAVRCDDAYLHIELVDGRILSVPLAWIPPLRDAAPAERSKVRISEDRTALIWDPDEGDVNEVLRVSDYLAAPSRR